MLHEFTLHEHLIGTAHSRRELNTPVLTIDRAALDRNIARMATIATSHGIALRPHAKTHKSVDIARRQLAAGAIGVCCAKLGEAEALAAGGIDNILITSPVVSAPAIARLVALNERIAQLAVVIDHPDNAAALASASAHRTLRVYIDVDPGIRRTGVASANAALELWRQLQHTPTLDFCGLQYYCGVQQHIGPFVERADAIKERTAYLQSVLALFAASGIKVPVVTGSGTGTHRIDAQLGVFTEWQVGSYVFMDHQYAQCDLTGDSTRPYEFSLFVEARVISANTRGMATLDAGFKALSTDGGSPVIVSGAPEGTTFHFMGDEHGAIVDPACQFMWKIGDQVKLAVPHCDPTVNLYDVYHVMNGDTLEALWSVSARGRSR